jgi:hypothetical protein
MSEINTFKKLLSSFTNEDMSDDSFHDKWLEFLPVFKEFFSCDRKGIVKEIEKEQEEWKEESEEWKEVSEDEENEKDQSEEESDSVSEDEEDSVDESE